MKEQAEPARQARSTRVKILPPVVNGYQRLLQDLLQPEDRAMPAKKYQERERKLLQLIKTYDVEQSDIDGMLRDMRLDGLAARERIPHLFSWLADLEHDHG